jgi:uncharacterized protein
VSITNNKKTGKNAVLREVRALVTAGEELKCRKLLILTENREGSETIEWFGKKASVRFLPLWKWLLNEG